MKVLLTADLAGGVWDHTVVLVRRLVEAGVAVRVAVFGDAGDPRLTALPTGVGLETRPLRLEWMPGGSLDLSRSVAWIRGAARVWGADVVHLNQLSLAGRLEVPTLVAVHSDVCSWFSEVRGQEPGPEWDEYRASVRRSLLAADAVVAPSGYQADLTEIHFERRVDRVIHNGIEPLRVRAPASGRGRMLVTAGRAWDDAKGAAVLDRAIGRLPPPAPDAWLLGDLDGPDGSAFRPERLRAAGRLPRAEVDGWLARALIYVGPSLYEPFGLAPLEAAHAGCPLILSDLGSFRELWDGCARFFPSGDEGALAAAIQELTADGALRDGLAGAAYERARTRFTAQRMAGEYLELYEDLLSGTVAAGQRLPSAHVAT